MNHLVTKIAAALAVTAFAAVPLYAQNAAPAGGDGPPMLANKLAPARGGSSRLLVTSNSFSYGGALPDKYTQNGDNVSPPLSWNKGPSGTQSFVVLTEDSGVNRHDPIFHWVLYNVPSTMTNLPSSIPTTPTVDFGADQGKNVRGAAGYVGPKPPAGQTHPYHFEVFALNTKLDLNPATTDRNAVVEAMKDHVLASGEIVVNYTGK
jgi:Raf kinase inhibitor-like YbhB/YbcL family protein